MIWTRNALTVAAIGYTPALDVYLGRPGAEKLSLRVAGAGVYLQVSEALDRGAYPDPIASEMLLEAGFHSRVFGRVYGYRLRAASATPAVVTVTAYG